MRSVRIWKFENIERFKKGQVGLLNSKIICEATAILASNIIQNSKDLVGNGAIYLSLDLGQIRNIEGKVIFLNYLNI